MIREKRGRAEYAYSFKEHRYKEHLVYYQSSICVEEPEVHLHPKYQSMLAEMFVEAYQKYNIHFIIETHSEYLIRKLQVMVADKENVLSPNDVSLNYVEKDENGVSHNRQIKIQEDGRLTEPFGPGFFDESKSLVMQMLKF
jgi:predicted ATPase